MSQIPQWIALSAFVYAMLILCVVLTYWTYQVVEGCFAWMDGLVERSVRLYRLLLATYPASFRREYGDAMVQLFRDTAHEAYRRRGLLGLVVMWLRTSVDFTISLIHQHRDKPVEVSSESVLLRDFLQKWRRLGSDALSVAAFSAWYGWHLLRLYFRRGALVWASLTAIASGIWFASFFDSLIWMRGRMTRVAIGGGTVQIRHTYEQGAVIPDEQYSRDHRAWLERNRRLVERFASPARPWEFSFFSDIPEGIVMESKATRDRQGQVRYVPVLIRPLKSWRLRFPFGIVPALLLNWTIRVYLRRRTGSVATVQSA